MVKRFLIQISVLSLFFLIAGAAVFGLFIPERFTPAVIFILLFNILLVNLIGYWLLRTSEKDSKKFDVNFRYSILIKMFASVLFIALMVFTYKEHVMVIIPCGLLFYISFSFLMIKTMLKIVKGKIV